MRGRRNKMEDKKGKASLITKVKENHFLAMLLCCAVPLTVIAGLSWLGLLGSWGYYALILLCPLMHIVMMRGMHKSHHNDDD
jgi:hypothetical protein